MEARTIRFSHRRRQVARPSSRTSRASASGKVGATLCSYVWGTGSLRSRSVRLGGTGGPDSRFLAMAFSRTKKSWPAGRELLAASEKLGFVAETEEGWFSATDAPLAHTPARKSSKGKSKSTRRDDDDDDVSFRLDRLEGILLQLTEVWATCHNMGKARTLSLGASPRRQVSGARHKGRERHLPARAAHWRPSRPRSAGRRCPKAFAGRRGPAARTSAQKRQTRRQRRQKRAGGRRPTIPSAL